MTATETTDQKVSLPTLTAMVIGSMIGSGVFLFKYCYRNSNCESITTSTIRGKWNRSMRNSINRRICKFK